jgi:hypothetical protein
MFVAEVALTMETASFFAFWSKKDKVHSVLKRPNYYFKNLLIIQRLFV